jgi:hypothetical protein
VRSVPVWSYPHAHMARLQGPDAAQPVRSAGGPGKFPAGVRDASIDRSNGVDPGKRTKGKKNFLSSSVSRQIRHTVQVDNNLFHKTVLNFLSFCFF